MPSCVQASHVSAVGHVNPTLIHLKQGHYPAGLAHAELLCKLFTKPALSLITYSCHLKLSLKVSTKHQPGYFPMLKVRKNWFLQFLFLFPLSLQCQICSLSFIVMPQHGICRNNVRRNNTSYGMEGISNDTRKSCSLTPGYFKENSFCVSDLFRH